MVLERVGNQLSFDGWSEPIADGLFRSLRPVLTSQRAEHGVFVRRQHAEAGGFQAAGWQCRQSLAEQGPRRRTFFNFTDCFSDAPSVRATDGMVVLHNDHVGLATAKPDGSGAAMLANTAPGDHWPVFSPDGQWIAFMRSPGAASAETKLYRIALDGTGLTMVGSLQNAASGAIVSTDGRRFVAYGSRDGEAALYAFDFLGTSEPVRVCIPAGGDVTFVGGAAE